MQVINYTEVEPVLTIENLSFSYDKKLILRNINFQLKDVHTSDKQRGQILGICGKSGSGKSTLFKLIAGLIKQSEGNLLIGAKQVAPNLKNLSIIQQNYPLMPHRTVLGNLKLISNDMDKINNYLDLLMIAEHKDKYPNQLSGGQKQRTAIAQAMLTEKEMLLMDEPFSGLDPVSIEKVTRGVRAITDLRDENTTIIISHDYVSLAALADTIILIGKEKDTQGNEIEGSVIRRVDDLKKMGLAWQEDIQSNPGFHAYCSQLRKDFLNL